LIGYDYCWNPKGNYYAFNKDGGGKASYMRHVYTRNAAGEDVYTSNNLGFSVMWLNKYIDVFKLPVVQCSRQSIFVTPSRGVLSDQMDYSFRQEDAERVRTYNGRLRQINAERQALQKDLNRISRDHYRSMMSSI
jgi:hypothetical protein